MVTLCPPFSPPLSSFSLTVSFCLCLPMVLGQAPSTQQVEGKAEVHWGTDYFLDGDETTL